MLSVCTRGLRVMQFQFSVCMYGTCGRIDNKADFDFDLTSVGLTCSYERFIACFCVFMWTRFFFKLRKSSVYTNNRVRVD